MIGAMGKRVAINNEQRSTHENLPWTVRALGFPTQNGTCLTCDLKLEMFKDFSNARTRAFMQVCFDLNQGADRISLRSQTDSVQFSLQFISNALPHLPELPLRWNFY